MIPSFSFIAVLEVSQNTSSSYMTFYNALIYNTPDVTAVTETKSNCNSSANIDFPNCKFYSTDSKTMAVGVGIYISSLNTIHRSDLSFEAESCWIEILQEHKPSI